LQYRLRNKPKSIKIIAKSSSKNIFRWIFTYLYFAFFLNKKTWKKIKKNVKTRKTRDLNKKRNYVYYIYVLNYLFICEFGHLSSK